LCCRCAAPTACIARCGFDWAEVSRGRSTGRDRSEWAGKGRTSSVAEESVVLVLVAVIAAIPHRVGPLLGGDGEVR
jgi:hypothetical protein